VQELLSLEAGGPMQPVISIAAAQRIIALTLFVVATAPVLLFGAGALRGYQPESFFQPLITIAAYPGGGAQWFAYLALLVSTWAGATLSGVFIVRVSDKPTLTRIGAAFLAYVALTVVLGLVFVVFVGVPANAGRLSEILPLSLINPDQSQDNAVIAARATAAIGEMSKYAHWAIGSLLTFSATILAMPAPPAPAARG
jgi:hypothetical protein